eukprot:5605982-Alexandrium_andersonii.AAC.1
MGRDALAAPRSRVAAPIARARATPWLPSAAACVVAPQLPPAVARRLAASAPPLLAQGRAE